MKYPMPGPAVHIPAEDAAQILMEGAQELLGADLLQNWAPNWSPEAGLHPEAVKELKNGQARDFVMKETGGLLQKLEETYGPRGGQGVALRIGRAAFCYGLHRLGETAGFYSVEFRLLPAPRRMESGLRVLAGALAELTGDEITVHTRQNGWLWQAKTPAAPAVRASAFGSSASCCLIAGLLQGFMSWAGGGRFYPVRETECRASGAAACSFQIDSKPVD